MPKYGVDQDGNPLPEVEKIPCQGIRIDLKDCLLATDCCQKVRFFFGLILFKHRPLRKKYLHFFSFFRRKKRLENVYKEVMFLNDATNCIIFYSNVNIRL